MVTEELLTVKEAARAAKRNPETIRRWIWSGKLPSQKFGTQHFIKAADLKALARPQARDGVEYSNKWSFIERARALREDIKKRIGGYLDVAEAVRASHEGHP